MPRGPVLARIRAAVVAEAAARAAADRPTLHPTAAELALARHQPGRFRWTRRAASLAMAATMAVGITGAVMAAPPGSALYNARIYIGNIALPSQPDLLLATREGHLEDRLEEAEAAAARGDAAGLAAALAAYQAEVDTTVAETGVNLDRLAHLEEMLAKHTARLNELAAELPEESSIDKAIEASSKAIEKVKNKGKNQGGPPDDPGNQDNSNRP